MAAKEIDPIQAIRALMVAAGVRPEALMDGWPEPEPRWGHALVSTGDGRCPVPGDEVIRVDCDTRGWVEYLAAAVDWGRPRTFRRLASTPDYDLGFEEDQL